MVAPVNHRTSPFPWASRAGIHRAHVATATAHARAVDAGRMASREYGPGRGSNSRPSARRSFKHDQGVLVLRPNHSAMAVVMQTIHDHGAGYGYCQNVSYNYIYKFN